MSSTDARDRQEHAPLPEGACLGGVRACSRHRLPCIRQYVLRGPFLALRSPCSICQAGWLPGMRHFHRFRLVSFAAPHPPLGLRLPYGSHICLLRSLSAPDDAAEGSTERPVERGANCGERNGSERAKVANVAEWKPSARKKADSRERTRPRRKMRH